MGATHDFSCTHCGYSTEIDSGRGRDWHDDESLTAYSCADCGEITTVKEKHKPVCRQCDGVNLTPLDYEAPNRCPYCGQKAFVKTALTMLWD